MPVSKKDRTPQQSATPTSRFEEVEYTDAYGVQPEYRVSPFAQAITLPRPHSNDNPLWKGPCGAGPLGGITQSMLVRFLSCRERFRLKYVVGLEPPERWNHRTGYGNMWHLCEEVFAGDPRGLCGAWRYRLEEYAQKEIAKHRFQAEEIEKWFNVCQVQFPEYVAHWQDHPDVLNRQPLMQEQVFDISYTVPSGRVVRLRGKFDSVDLIDGGIYLQENKSKGDIDKQQVERQLKFDLQTMTYLIALDAVKKELVGGFITPLCGVRYNVVRRPLSGGKGSIKPHEATMGAKCTKCKMDPVKQPTCVKCGGAGRTGGKPAEPLDEFYERLRRDYIAADPDYWFFRVRSEVSAEDIKVFRDTCLDPILEQLCWWYDEVTGRDTAEAAYHYGYPPANYRTPFGVYSALEEGGATEYDAYLATGSEAGLRRVETLFTELQDAA